MDSTVDDLTTDVIESCGSRELDHLGLVVGMYDELEIGKCIDQHIAQDFEQCRVTVGQAVKAMVVNGLRFVRQSLYLTPQFFESRLTERLIGEGTVSSGASCFPIGQSRQFDQPPSKDERALPDALPDAVQ